ncbi:acetyl-CoA carboxylase biotin carboxyl carrier protein subunit [Sphingopyxis sp. J-6]|uniref:acetyl-CoA carboxylase biotin carboxyl carrier protein subunit n=1 Tax=Sphingopyxis sp. J-6 TaxID=3122054 RepID=UPI003984522D
MSSTIEEVRALLASFTASPWRDLHFRSGGWSLFMAKADGGANPMLARAGQAVAAAVAALRDVTAPHLGIFSARVAPGAEVEAGTVIGQVDKLGEATDIVSETAGRVAAILPSDGDLVEYGAPLVRIESA